MRKIGAKQDLF